MCKTKVTTPDDCLACDLCSDTAPTIFAKDSNGKSFVKKQPQNREEVRAAEDAMLNCPIEGIEIIDA